jgi:hypothetical protein
MIFSITHCRCIRRQPPSTSLIVPQAGRSSPTFGKHQARRQKESGRGERVDRECFVFILGPRDR